MRRGHSKEEKQLNENGEIISVQGSTASPNDINDPNLVLITEEEYNSILAQFTEQTEVGEIEPTYDELKAENERLEKENAELLFRSLTGENLDAI